MAGQTSRARLAEQGEAGHFLLKVYEEKRREDWMKKTLLTVMLVIFIAAGLAGCHTMNGVKEDVQTVPQTMTNSGHAIIKADNWLKENLW
jgi:predicted small secreted protein